MMRRVGIPLVFALQIACVGFFLWEILSSVFGLPPMSWELVEIIEICAAMGLVLGAVMGGVVLRRALRRTAQVEGQLRVASGAFMELLAERFEDWRLTPAERDVALFSIKGLSTADIATLRVTSEGTVKAQTNAIYRKAGVTGRPQLLSLFIEDLIDGPVEDRKGQALTAAGDTPLRQAEEG